MNRTLWVVLSMALVGSSACLHERDSAVTEQASVAADDPRHLRAVSSFTSFESDETRSVALFLEASKVLSHPRCSNCHPPGETPLQGLDQHPHEPPVVRGSDDQGVIGMECVTCHQTQNQVLARVPGAPKWALAPVKMAWVGKTNREVCQQLQDPRRNGGKTLAQIVEHSAHDELVAWAWVPGQGREPAPGSQREFGALMAAWVDSGAHCPKEPPR